jgi:acetylornithine aminotransferase
MVASVRGSGLLIGVVLKEAIAKKMISDLQQSGILANATSDSVIRLAPPLIISDSQVLHFIETFRKVSANYER